MALTVFFTPSAGVVWLLLAGGGVSGAAGGGHWAGELRRPALQVLQGGVDPRLPRPQAMLLRVRLLQDQGRYVYISLPGNHIRQIDMIAFAEQNI